MEEELHFLTVLYKKNILSDNSSSCPHPHRSKANGGGRKRSSKKHLGLGGGRRCLLSVLKY